MEKKTINYSDNFINLLFNTFYTRKKIRYYEPNSEDNNNSIISLLNKEKKYVIIADKKIESVENKNIEEHHGFDFDECDLIFVGQTRKEGKIDVSKYPYLDKYNLKNIRQMDYQLFYILTGIEKLSQSGTMYINVPLSYLYRNDLSGQCLRQYIVDNHLLSGIALIKGTCGISDYEVIISLSKEKKDNVVFVDAKNNDYQYFYDYEYFYGNEESNDFFNISANDTANIFILFKIKKDLEGVSKVVPYDDIIANDYNLQITNYVKVTKKRTHRTLVEIANDINATYDEMERNSKYYHFLR